MRYLNLLLLLIGFSSSYAQEKIEWTYTFDKEKSAIELQAKLEEGWHLYSQHVQNDIGPVPTAFTWKENDQVKFIGRVIEPTPIQKYDETFEAMLDFFEGNVTFTQRVSVKKDTEVHGSITYMICNSTMCYPPVDKEFAIVLSK